jgi:eukaryotic-like serine/threonine-protein kinase
MDSFGHYSIQERVHVCELGELMRARDPRLGRTVALRIVSPDIVSDPVRRDALMADAAVASALLHPHIAALYDFGEEGGRVFLAHEFVAGQPLRTHLAGKPLDIELALEFAVQLADAVAEGHAQGIVHGNLCPSTIFITPTDQAKIIGFGLGSWTSSGRERTAITKQIVAGTDPTTPHAATVVPYMSPEQVLGSRVDARTDVFSLGLVLYEMFTGRRPFSADNAVDTAVLILQGTAEPASRVNPKLPPELDAILGRATAKSLDARPSAAQLAAELRSLARTLNIRVTAEVVRPKTVMPARARSAPHRARLVGVVAAILLALLAGTGAAGWRWRHEIGRYFGGGSPAERPVVIVLPFEMTAGDSRAYYGVGFAEDLAARLGEVPGLTVVGRTSIGESSSLSLKQRAERAGAALAIRGRIRPGTYQLHLDVELVDVATGTILWAEQYAREPRQASAAEVEIAKQVADELHLERPTGNRWTKALTRQTDPGAYDFYLQAKAAAWSRDRSRAIDLYRQALNIDPKLVEAHIGLSEAYYLEDFYSGGNQGSALDDAQKEAAAALAMEPDLPRAHMVAALSAPTMSWAASSLARALTFDPSFGEAWHHAGDLLAELDPARALAYYRKALQLEPTIDSSHRDIAAANEALDDLQDAETALEAGRSARPDRPWWTQMQARLEIAGKNYDMAAQTLAASPSTESLPSAWLIGRILPLKMGSRDDEARKELVRLLERYPSYCEAQAVSVGFALDAKDAARSRALADAIFVRAAAPDANPGMLSCAALAAASLGDGPETAGFVAKLAADERALRVWTRQAVFNVAFSFRRRLYPWTKVETSAPFTQASDDLKQHLDRIRDEAGHRLPPAPTEAHATR